jgi:hypothetical protein
VNVQRAKRFTLRPLKRRCSDFVHRQLVYAPV